MKKNGAAVFDIQGRCLFLLTALFFFTFLFPCFAEAVEPDAAGHTPEYTPVIIVFPYFSPDESIAFDIAYALYAVPDMVRERLLDENRFVLVEKNTAEEKANAAFLPPDYYVSDASRLSVARACDADFFIWGYLLRTPDMLVLFHGLVDVKSGRTLYLEKTEMPEGRELFAAMENSVLAFQEWTKRELPEKISVDVKPGRMQSESTVSGNPVRTENGSDVSLSLQLGCLIHPFTFKDTLSPSVSAGIGLEYKKKNEDALGFGFEGFFTKMTSISSDSQKIEVVLMPIHALLRYAHSVSPVIDFDVSLSAGASFLFGRVNNEFLSYARPSALADIDLSVFLRKGMALEFGCAFLYVYHSYQNQDMISIMPKTALKIKL